LPSDFLSGIDLQRKEFERGYPSYLRGQWRFGGWWYYYLYAMAVKVPLGLWGLVIWGIARAALARPGVGGNDPTVLVPAALILAFVSSQTGFNHHMRYVLPAFPFVFVCAAGVGRELRRETPWRGLILIALMGWTLVSVLRVYPYSMSYFNECVGGPLNGHDHPGRRHLISRAE
jgi:hypothetical protein